MRASLPLALFLVLTSSCGGDDAADAAVDSAVDAAVDGSPDTGPDGAMDSGLDAASDTGSDASRDAAMDADADTSTDAALDAAGDAGIDIRVDFGNWAADPTGNWVLMPLGSMDMLLEGLIDFTTGMATPVSLTSDAEWIASGGDASNWTAGDVDWLPQIVAQDAWGGNVVGNTVRFAGVGGAVQVEVVVGSGFEREDMRIEVNGATTTTTFRGRADADSAAFNAETDGTDMADWLVWPRVTPVGGVVEVSLTPGLLSAIRLSPPASP